MTRSRGRPRPGSRPVARNLLQTGRADPGRALRRAPGGRRRHCGLAEGIVVEDDGQLGGPAVARSALDVGDAATPGSSRGGPARRHVCAASAVPSLRRGSARGRRERPGREARAQRLVTAGAVRRVGIGGTSRLCSWYTESPGRRRRATSTMAASHGGGAPADALAEPLPDAARFSAAVRACPARRRARRRRRAAPAAASGSRAERRRFRSRSRARASGSGRGRQRAWRASRR